MAYRFDLKGTEVECDSLEELLGAIGQPKVQAVIAHEVVADTRPVRAPSVGGKKTKRNRRAATSAFASKRSWALARYYSAKNGNMGISEARAYLSNNPEKKASVTKEMVRAGLLEPAA
jgi:hypothetical protein